MPKLSNAMNAFHFHLKSNVYGADIKLFLLFTLITGIFFFVACSAPEVNERELITEKIQYDVSIKNLNADYDWWIENLPGPQREKLIDWIFEKARKGELPAYDYFNKAISPEKIERIGTDTIYRTLTRDYPPFEEYDTLIVTHLEMKDITKVRFLERWYWNEDREGIEKEVIGIAPVLQKLDAKGNFIANYPLFWLYLVEGYPEE